MTAILALTIIVILLIARYYGSPKLALNLLLTLAISVMVGYGISELTEKNDSNDAVSTELVMINPTQSLDQLAIVPSSLIGVVGKDENYTQICTKPTDAPGFFYSTWDRRIAEEIDSS